MFTVKHITNTYEEFLYTAETTNYVPASAKGVGNAQSGPAPVYADSVWLRGSDRDNTFEITGGRVYVMNEQGATVAKYDLEPAFGIALPQAA
jgi:hypothetical protein